METEPRAFELSYIPTTTTPFLKILRQDLAKSLNYQSWIGICDPAASAAQSAGVINRSVPHAHCGEETLSQILCLILVLSGRTQDEAFSVYVTGGFSKKTRQTQNSASESKELKAAAWGL